MILLTVDSLKTFIWYFVTILSLEILRNYPQKVSMSANPVLWIYTILFDFSKSPLVCQILPYLPREGTPILRQVLKCRWRNRISSELFNFVYILNSTSLREARQVYAMCILRLYYQRYFDRRNKLRIKRQGSTFFEA